MDPISIGLGIAGIAGNLLNGSKAAKAAKQQLALQKWIAEKQMAIADEQLTMAKELQRAGFATQVDASGNMTYYDKESNTWKSVLSPPQQVLQNLSDNELRQQLSVDAPLNRAEALAASARRGQAGQTADTLLMQANNALANPVTGASMASALRRSRSNAMTSGEQEARGMAIRSAARTGSSGLAAALSRMASERSAEYNKNIGNPDLEGMQLADQLNDDRSVNKLNAYNAMASRAEGGGQQIGTFNLAPKLTEAVANRSALGMQGLNAAGNTMQGAGSGVGAFTQVPQTDWAGIMGSINDLYKGSGIKLGGRKTTGGGGGAGGGYVWTENDGA